MGIAGKEADKTTEETGHRTRAMVNNMFPPCWRPGCAQRDACCDLLVGPGYVGWRAAAARRLNRDKGLGPVTL